MTDLLELTGFHVDDVPDVDAFVARVREFAAQGLEVGHFWVIAAGPKDVRAADHVELEFGISDKPGVGVLAFGQGDEHYVPAHGTNEDEVEYMLGGLHPSYLPAKAEVPLEDVYAGLDQFLHTQRCPVVLDWIQVSG
ncbi:hypothetical protein BJF85_02155 [Saccharomonospora sp. CUA-673]|uniref:Imm1 family immunity protein n=1 Tax=Saccharomonospora sp. CUA-673 TaxID=1904969 RepID=UPI00096A0488|nr:Imm1 family immunity protein [Saccharomonospora sp. CUA-673]OLT45211.1 hypothetical protein BJF85_02155 [Saccharomonospora sp. CUA-673]